MLNYNRKSLLYLMQQAFFACLQSLNNFNGFVYLKNQIKLSNQLYI